MEVKKAILERRALRSIEPFEVTQELIYDLAESASLAPSCFNNQPWRFIFTYDPDILKELYTALTPRNNWANNSSLIVTVFTKEDLDCQIKGRNYALLDTGMAVGFMLLRATELGLIAHPIAGYDEEKVKKILNIPEDMTAILLIVFGKRAKEINPNLSEEQKEREFKRPERLPIKEFVYLNKYK
ncbi:nitroreductase family protein [Dictyoglomus thermophilum]|uniref:Bacterioferritin comigratory protein/NADH dehydrogenase n=2 Tax=Dictyoglomus thermophilum TaxID=14 RepID=B5YA76_DICT6|nr:nitroreductase family protein [Dictyoglomus thermophilum]ACI18328.1 bacterioferritin comigratory protein/NADH dehydrogenase [Dictyoglomus thermophilum H-6-12]TYT24524.1 nitroreductase [Dictyoglomus thermophilum]